VASASIDGVVDSGSSGSGSNKPLTGVTVRVQGTGLVATTNDQGRFSLSGVPVGDRMLSFEQSGQSADLFIAGVKPGEHIQLVVALDGSTLEVESMDRGGGVTGQPGVALQKFTNGEDADQAPGPSIPVGESVAWEYFVRNTGEVELTDVGVTDDQGVTVVCPATTLPAGESMTCTGRGTAVEGQYANMGTVTATDPEGGRPTASDPSHYFGTTGGAAIDLEKATNGEDADKAPGPTIPVGAPVVWDYVVRNTGPLDLFDVLVTDDQKVLVSCPTSTLLVGESMTCTASGVAVEGQYANLGTAIATDVDGNPVQDEDMSHYFGEASGGDDYTVQIQPDNWNTNWIGSSGTVSAKIQGGDLTAIDPTSILLFESDPAVAVAPVGVPGITGNHLRARFPKSEAFLMLADPQTGETRTVIVSFLSAGAVVDLPVEIRIVGPAL
jgi:hypothetical protein